MLHFGDPCIHCAIPHDDVPVGECRGDPSKATPVSWRSLGVRPDGVEHYRIRMSDGAVKEMHSHISNHSPYYHFGQSDDLVQPPRYDEKL